MPDHQVCLGVLQHIPEGTPIGCLQLRQGRVQTGTEMMGVGTNAAQSRKMLQGCTKARCLKPKDIRSGDVGDNSRIIGNRAVADQRVEIESIAFDSGRKSSTGARLRLTPSAASSRP